MEKKVLCKKLGQVYKEPSNRSEVKVIMGINDKNEVIRLSQVKKEKLNGVIGSIVEVEKTGTKII